MPLTFSQVDPTRLDENKLLIEPELHGVRIDAVTLLIFHQVGGQIDFDLLQSSNKKICVGTRLSVEHYSLQNFVEKVSGSPFTNYNLFARVTNRRNLFSVNLLGGVTYYTADSQTSKTKRYLFRVGFEARFGSMAALVLKGSTSLMDKSYFIGFGISIGYDHNW